MNFSEFLPCRVMFKRTVIADISHREVSCESKKEECMCFDAACEDFHLEENSILCGIPLCAILLLGIRLLQIEICSSQTRLIMSLLPNQNASF